MSDVIIEGKTKIIHKGCLKNTVLLETKNRLTAGDAVKVADLKDIAAHKTTQTVNVFKFLNKAGIPTSFLGQENDVTIMCRWCDMIPLEVVTRRYAWGSFLKRNPDFPQYRKTKEGQMRSVYAPILFGTPLTELYHKNSIVMPPLVKKPTLVQESSARDLFMEGTTWKGEVVTDPLCSTGEDYWGLFHPKKPSVDPLMKIDPVLSQKEETEIRELAINVFSLLEQAWKSVDCLPYKSISLADMKIEVGTTSEGKLVVSDVIDNDSWRIWPDENPRKQLDKQVFRDASLEGMDETLTCVSSNYELVAELTSRF